MDIDCPQEKSLSVIIWDTTVIVGVRADPRRKAKIILRDAAFLLTVGSFLLTVELFYLQLTILAILLTVGASLLTVLSCLLTVGAFCLQWEVSASNKGLQGLQAKKPEL